MPGECAGACIIVAIETGRLRGEIVGLTWDQIDLDNGVIPVVMTKIGDRRISASACVKLGAKNVCCYSRESAGVAKHPDGDALLKSYCASVGLCCACCCLKRSFRR